MKIKTERPGSPVGSLSGGNQQKVALAAALAVEPELLIAEEPTSGVDLNTKREIYVILREFVAAGGAVVLFVTELEDAMACADRIFAVRDGDIAGAVDIEGLGNLEESRRPRELDARGSCQVGRLMVLDDAQQAAVAAPQVVAGTAVSGPGGAAPPTSTARQRASALRRSVARIGGLVIAMVAASIYFDVRNSAFLTTGNVLLIFEATSSSRSSLSARPWFCSQARSISRSARSTDSARWRRGCCGYTGGRSPCGARRPPVRGRLRARERRDHDRRESELVHHDPWDAVPGPGDHSPGQQQHGTEPALHPPRLQHLRGLRRRPGLQPGSGANLLDARRSG